MSEKSAVDWAEQIQLYQQAYRDAWQAFFPNSKGSASEPPGNGQAGNDALENPWIDAMNQWWRSVSEGSAEPVNAFYEKLVEQGKACLELTETVSAAFNQAQAGSEATVSQWQSLIEQATENFQQVFRHSAWQMPLANFQKVMASMSFMPGDSLPGLELSSLDFVTDKVQGHLEKILSTPGVGQTREKQEQHQKLARLLLNYRGALQEYAQAQAEIGLLSTRRFQERLMEIASRDEQETLTSFKQVYDCWVDCCEEVYTEYVMTDQYVAIHGNVVNTLMAVKQQSRAIVDEGLGMLNMPTRREIDTVHRQFHQIRRAEKAQQKELAGLKTKLFARLEAQAEQIEALQKQIKATEVKGKTATQAKAPARSGGTQSAVSTSATKSSRAAAKPSASKQAAPKATSASNRPARKTPPTRARTKNTDA